MSLMRKVALGAGGVFVLTAGAATWMVLTFDPNAHKQVLEDWVQTHRERTLKLEGPVSLGLWPRIHVRLQDVSLSAHRSADEFARLGEVDLAVQLMPLLQGRLEVGQVTARSGVLRYTRDAQGRSNIDDLLTPTSTPQADDTPLNFDVQAIALQDLKVDVQDAISGVQGTLTLSRLDSGRLAPGVPTDVAVAAQLAMAQPQALTVDLQGALKLTPDLAQQRVEAQDVDLTVRIKAAAGAAGDADLQWTLKAATAGWDGRSQAVATTRLAWQGQGRVGQGADALQLDDGRVTADELRFEPKGQVLNLSKLVVDVRAQQGGLAREASLNWPNLQVQGTQLKGSPLEGRFKVAGPVAVDGRLRSGAPTGSFEAIRLPGLTVDFKAQMAGQGGARQVEGSLSTLLQARPQAATAVLEALTLDAKLSEPSLQPLHLQAKGQVQWTTERAAIWQLQGQINDNAFTTQGQLRTAPKVPQVQAKAQFAALDLNRLLPVPSGGAAPSSTASDPAALDRTPVDLSALRSVDGQFELRAGDLAWQQHRVTDAVVRADLQGGRLSLHELSGGAWRGRFKAQGSAHAGGDQAMTLKAQAEGIDILALLQEVAGKDVLEGRGQLALDLRTQGPTVGALTAALNGQGRLELRDGAVRGINLAKSLREARARLSGQRDAVQKASTIEKTDFSELSASFIITDGIARNQDLNAKSPFLRVTGRGEADLPRRRVDYTVQATVTGTVKGQDGADIEALKGLTVPVRLSGPFAALDWNIAWSGVALGAVQNTVKGQLDSRLNQEGKKLEDQLKTKLLGKPTPAASGASEPAPARLEDQAKDQLKNKLRGLFK